MEAMMSMLLPPSLHQTPYSQVALSAISLLLALSSKSSVWPHWPSNESYVSEPPKYCASIRTS